MEKVKGSNNIITIEVDQGKQFTDKEIIDIINRSRIEIGGNETKSNSILKIDLLQNV